MVNTFAVTVASVVLLLGSTTKADNALSDAAQYTTSADDEDVTQLESTQPPDASTVSDPNSGARETSKPSWTQLPRENNWTSLPASSTRNSDSWTQVPVETPGNSWQPSISSSQSSKNNWTQAPPSSSKSIGDSDDNNTDAPPSTSKPSGSSWKQEPVISSDGSQTSDDNTSSADSQTSGDTTSSTASQVSGGSGDGGNTTPSTTGGSVPDGTWPTSTGTVQFAEAHIIKAGEVFDGKMQTFERSDIKCEGQKESGASTAVFKLEAGATLKNAIIGKNQMEGVHCDKHDCIIDNVWWDDVCEDALSIKGGTASSVSTVTGGGARSADDKVIQHNGVGTVKIDGFYAEDFGKLYRSCGTCGDKQRTVVVSNVYAVNPSASFVTVNKNYNDHATLSNIWIKPSKDKGEGVSMDVSKAASTSSIPGASGSSPTQWSQAPVPSSGSKDATSATSSASSAGKSLPSWKQDLQSTDWESDPQDQTSQQDVTKIGGDGSGSRNPATAELSRCLPFHYLLVVGVV
ncbi:unnamed protein product [Phytophthora lilii]|uniref:Probable pectate lyase F n=1 Tax=Phytophthora lilii TaxID=2077276 RepID=A0A9W6TEF3_9STRA|nr:unnamed protein product [Phytophthora lilii]